MTNKGALATIRRIRRELKTIQALLRDDKLGKHQDVDALSLAVDRACLCATNVATRLGDTYETVS